MPHPEPSVSTHMLRGVHVALLVFSDANRWIASDIHGNVAESYESREAAIVRWLRENCEEYEESEAFYNDSTEENV